MYSLPCPSCQTPTDVSPSQAGDQLACPACGATIQIPKLGDLRKLPRTSENAGIPSKSADETAVGGRIGFVVLSLISLFSLLISGFCGIQWANVDAPITTATHLQDVRETYSKLEAARLIREFEDMEKYGLTIASPYQYKQQLNKKNAWGQKALIAAVVCCGCGIMAFILAGSTRAAVKDT